MTVTPLRLVVLNITILSMFYSLRPYLPGAVGHGGGVDAGPALRAGALSSDLFSGYGGRSGGPRIAPPARRRTPRLAARVSEARRHVIDEGVPTQVDLSALAGLVLADLAASDIVVSARPAVAVAVAPAPTHELAASVPPAAEVVPVIPEAAESAAPALPSIASLPRPGAPSEAEDEDEASENDEELTPPVAGQVHVLFEAPALELASEVPSDDRSGELPQSPGDDNQLAAAPIELAPIEPTEIVPAASEPVMAMTTVERYSSVVKEVRHDLKAKAWDTALRKVEVALGLEDLIGEQRAWLLYLKARAERGRGRPLAAARLYAEAIDFDPPGTHYKNSLAWVLATSKNARLRDVPRAVRLAEEAAQEGAGKAQYLDTLARAYFEAGRFAEAVTTQEKALAKVPQNKRYRQRLDWYRGEAIQIAGVR